MSFLESIAKKGLIPEERIGEIKNLAEAKYSGNIEAALSEYGMREEEILAEKGSFYKLPTARVNVHTISFDVLKNIPKDAALHYRFAPIELLDGVLSVGVTDPENTEAIDALAFISNKLGIPFKVYLISQANWQEVMEVYEGLSSQVAESLDELNQASDNEEKKILNEASHINH